MSVLDRMRRAGSSDTHQPETLQGTPPRPPAYQGSLQGIGNGNVLGWCWDPRMPEQGVPIAIAVDGEIVAEGKTDIDRPDLAEVGEGARGFLIALPKSLQSPGRHRVLALAGAEQVPLEAAPSFWLDAGSGGGWSDVVFEPGDLLPSETPSAQVPEPPAQADPNAVISDGWLLDAREFDPHPNPTPADLDARVSTLTATAKACAALGLRYVPVIAPAKRAVLGAAPVLDRRWMVELRARLRDVDGVEVMDLLPILRDGARHGTTYHRTDSGWNDRGAFFVARALIKETRKWVPTLRPLPLDDLHLCPVARYWGGLADAPRFEPCDGELVPSESTVEAEDGVIIDASRLRALRMPLESHLAEAASTHIRVYANPELEEDARLAIVGDSACLSLIPWLAECAYRTTFFWSDALPLHELELELPPVVFHLIREADLLTGFATLAVDATSLECASSSPVRELPPAKPTIAPPYLPVISANGVNGNGSRPIEPEESEVVTHIHTPKRLDRRGPLLLLGGGLLACALLLLLISRHLSIGSPQPPSPVPHPLTGTNSTVTAAPAPTAAGSATSATSPIAVGTTRATTATSQDFRADTHHLPWLYEGQKLLSPRQIPSLPEADRELADTVLLDAEALPLEPPSAKALRTAVPAVLVSHSSQMRVARTPIAGASNRCTLLTPSTPGDAAVVSVAPGHGLYLSMPATGQVSLYAHRYANRFSTKPLHLLKSAGAPAIARFPADASTRPWQIELVPTTPTAVCLV